jgi:hypothetical protein
MNYWQNYAPYANWLPLGTPNNMVYPQTHNINWPFVQIPYQTNF